MMIPSETQLVYSDQDNTLLTTSLLVADEFNYEHRNILKRIRDMIEEYENDGDKEWASSNFMLVEYIDSKGEKRPMYILTEEAYSLVAMRFTGSKARKKQKKYAIAFSAMKRELFKLHKLLQSQLKADNLKLEETEKENEQLKAELRPVIDNLASVSKHLKLLGVNDKGLRSKILDMVTKRLRERKVVVDKFDREPKKGFEQDVKVNKGLVYDTVLVTPELIESCLICLEVEV